MPLPPPLLPLRGQEHESAGTVTSGHMDSKAALGRARRDAGPGGAQTQRAGLDSILRWTGHPRSSFPLDGLPSSLHQSVRAALPRYQNQAAETTEIHCRDHGAGRLRSRCERVGSFEALLGLETAVCTFAGSSPSSHVCSKSALWIRAPVTPD